MADLQRLENHLQDVRFCARVGPIESYRARRRAAMGACNKLLVKVPGEEAKNYIRGIKRQIKGVEYTGDWREYIER